MDGAFNRMATNGKLGAIIGDVVRNAIPLNSIETTNADTAGTIVYAGYAIDGEREYLALCHVNRMRGTLNNVEWVDVLHSLNGRTKKDTSRSGEEPQLDFSIAGTDVSISIADLLDVVKELHPDLLSRDVIENHYGEIWQPEGYYKGITKFSVKDVTPEDTQRLEKENARLKAELENARAQVRLTGGNQVSAQAVEKLARKIVRDTHSKYDAASLAGDLGQIYTYAATAENSEEALREIDDVGIGLAKKVLRQSEQMDTTVSDQLTGLKDYLRNTGLSLNEDQKAEAAAMYGSYNDFRRQVFGTIKLTRDGVPLDVAWGELHDAYPWLFDADGTDILESLVHAAELTRPQLVNPYGYNLDEAAADLWLTMQQEYANQPVNRTYADRQKARLDALRAEQAENLRRMRQEAKDRYEERLKAVKAENRAKRAELSEQYKKAVEDVKTAERMAEGRLRAKERQKAQEQLRAAKQRANELVKQHQLLANEKLAQQQARSDTRILALEAQVRELKQLVKDERVAGKANTANESKRREYRNEVIESATSLSDWIMSPLRSKRHIPKDLLYAIADAVASIDLGDGKHMSAEVQQWRERVARMRAAAALVNEPVYSEQYGDVQKKLEELAENHKTYQSFTGNKDTKAAENRRKRDERIQQDARLVSQFVPEVKGSLNIDQMGIDELRGLARTLKTIERAVIHTSEQRDRTDAEKYRTRIVANAKTLAGWLTTPSDKRFVPEELRTETARFVAAIELGFGEGTKSRADWLHRMDRMMAAVENANKAAPSNGTVEFDQESVDALKEITEAVKGDERIRSIRDMSVEQLRGLSDALAAIKHQIVFADKIFVAGRRESIAMVGDDTIQRALKTSTRKGNEVRKKLLGNALLVNNLKPIYFFKNLGGKLKRVGDDLMQGETDWAFHMRNARDFHKGVKERFDVKSWMNRKGDVLKLKTELGEEIELTRDQALMLYAIDRREKLDTHTSHLKTGGFVYGADKKGKVKDDATAHPLSDADMQQIRNWLTDDQRQYAEQLVGYMSTTLAGIGNQTSLRLVGYKKFTGEHYVPFKVAGEYVQSDPGKSGEQQQSVRQKNKGFTKSVKANANGPIVLEGLSKVFARHTQEMCTYAAMKMLFVRR